MPSSITIGGAVLAAGVAGGAVNLWARDAFPAQWGGPNIGGGMLLLLCVLLAVVGAATVVAGLIRYGWRRPRPRSTRRRRSR